MSKFWRSVEMPLINCKVELSLTWDPNNSKHNICWKWLHRRIAWSSCQGVTRLFVLAYRDDGGANRATADSHRRCFLPRVKIENYNIETDGRNFYDQKSINRTR